MIKVAVCDDDEVNLMKVKEFLEETYSKEIAVTTFQDPASMICHMEESMWDYFEIILMDIQLGEQNGIQISKELHRKYPMIKVIFMTGYIDYARDIFDADPVYFLVKPLYEDKMAVALDKAIEQVKDARRESLILKTKNGIVIVPINEIIYIESERRLLHIYTLKGIVTYMKKMNELLEELPDNFLRCHQSYAVNMAQIQRFVGFGVLLCNGERIPVSRGRHKEAKDIFQQYIGENI